MTIISKNQIELLNLFRKNIFLSETIRKISIILKKDYPATYNTLMELEKKDIVKIKKVGNSKICEIKFTPEAISILSFLDEQEFLSKNIPNIKKILDFKEFLDDVLLVTGSYAKGKQTKNSDIDLVVISKDSVIKKQKLLENLTTLLIPKIHPVVVSYKDFIGMLLDKEENYGKEIFKNKLLFRNSERYYELIKEAIENGFRG